ncbi:MAG: hypothetical protein LBF93_04375 [Zoogloeaceae bacterium]|jgi:hypothetical protein|nr:hypothetical protein [Zoogloeaceae bacterium]
MESFKDALKTAAVIVFILLAFGIVGSMDYEDAIALEAERDAYTRALANCVNGERHEH